MLELKVKEEEDAEPEYTTSAHWMDGEPVITVNHPKMSNTLQAPTGHSRATGTCFDTGLGWGDTHYYEKYHQVNAVEVLSIKQKSYAVLLHNMTLKYIC